VKSTFAGLSQKLDESGQRNPKAHAASDQLDDIHGMEAGEPRSLREVEKSADADEKRHKNSRRHIPISIAHARFPR
jgi:hypothetical protein